MDYRIELQNFLSDQGYQRLIHDSKNLWIKEIEGKLALIELIPELLMGQKEIPIDQRQEELAHIKNLLMVKYSMVVDDLSLLVSKGMPTKTAKEELMQYPNIWWIDRSDGQLFLYENQRSDFYGLMTPLEHFLNLYQDTAKAEVKKEWRRLYTPVNTAIIVLNILVFVLMTAIGDTENADFMANHGAMVYDAVAQQKEYYRFITSMFLHFGLDHLFQNMLVLALMGCRLERLTGSVGYAVIYLASGLTGALASLFFTLQAEPLTVSAGASGAIFGVMGGLLAFILLDVIRGHRKRMREIGLTGILFMIGATLSYGFFETGIDNFAHIGGLIGGLAFTLLWSLTENMSKHS